MSIKEQLQKPGCERHITGHGMTVPERYAPDTRHMVILDIRIDHAGHAAGGRIRQFLTDEGYNEVVQTDGRGYVKIIRHARVCMGELEYKDRLLCCCGKQIGRLVACPAFKRPIV